MVLISAYMDSSPTCRDSPHVSNLQYDFSQAMRASIFSLVRPKSIPHSSNMSNSTSMNRFKSTMSSTYIFIAPS